MDEREEALFLRRTDAFKAANARLDRYSAEFPSLTPSQKALCSALNALTLLGRDGEALALTTHWYSREGITR